MAVRTVLGWTVSGPLERFEKDKHRANFIRSDSNLSEQYQNFCDMEFNDSTYHRTNRNVKRRFSDPERKS